jgi:hypothetical protein
VPTVTRDYTRVVRVPCQTLSDEFLWRMIRNSEGLQVGVGVGSQSTSNSVTNNQMITKCPPSCTPDPTPNPSATLNGSGAVGQVSVGYNVSPHTNFFSGDNPDFGFGVEVFARFGSNSTTIPTIPGTGAIAPPAVMANDSTTVQFGNQYGLLGKIRMVLTPGGLPISLAFDAGSAGRTSICA